METTHAPPIFPAHELRPQVGELVVDGERFLLTPLQTRIVERLAQAYPQYVEPDTPNFKFAAHKLRKLTGRSELIQYRRGWGYRLDRPCAVVRVDSQGREFVAR